MIRLPFFRAALAAALFLLPGCDDSDADAAALVEDAEVVAVAEPAPEPEPPAPAEEAPEVIRGLYLNAYAAGSRNRLPELIEIADETEINTFVVDVKDERGIHYRGSQVALANELSQEGELTIRDLDAFVDTLHAHDIYAIARVVLFKDPILSKAKPDWSIQQPGGDLWVDKAGNTWVSAWDERVWDYNLDIAEEAARAGFDEIQFDYVRFPEPYGSLPEQIHPRAEGDRTDAIAAFLNEAKRRLHPLGAVVAADVFGLSPNTPDDINIGQQWETIASTADHILPMMYPSHYLPTHLPNVRDPDLMPYETLYKSAGMAALRNERLQEAGVEPARVIPWLQAFTATWLSNHRDYGAEELREQKRGVYDVGFDDWVLWHPGSKYEHIRAGLEETAEPRAKEYTPPKDVLNTVNRFESQGIKKARQQAAAQARGETTDAEAAEAARTGEETRE
jgi:hypothetical protein